MPPSTTNSATSGPDNASASVTPTPANQTAPAPVSITKVAQSSTSSASAVVKETENPLSLKTAVGPPAVHAATPSSSSESSSTPESVASNNSSSELSHSLEDTDTDLDPDQTGSQCSSLSSSTVSSSVLVQPTIKSSSNQVEESEKSLRTSAKSEQETTTASNSRPETDSDLNLKLDEAEKRHSAMGKYSGNDMKMVKSQHRTWWGWHNSLNGFIINCTWPVSTILKQSTAGAEVITSTCCLCLSFWHIKTFIYQSSVNHQSAVLALIANTPFVR